MTREDLQQIIYDPSLMQKKVLDYIEEFSNGERVVSDPTNPFVMLLEAATISASASVIETNNIIRKKYPSLANKEDDLYVHVTDKELTNMFSIPSELTVIFYVNIIDLKLQGYRQGNSNFVETIIPKYTKLEILGVPFTLLNDIVIRMYDNNNLFVEVQINNENDMAYSDQGTLEAKIYNSSEETAWITFQVKVKQLNRITSNKTIIASDGFSQLVSIKDKYCYASVSYSNASTNGSFVPMNKSHNEEYVNPQKPTAYISVYDKNVLFKIPDVYLVDGGIDGSILIEVYETKGKLYLPVNKYKTSDWAITLGDTSTSLPASTSQNISIMVHSLDIIDGGIDGFTLEELRTAIINNTMGDIELPITDKQLERTSLINGYNITKSEDVITSRLYIALRSLPSFDSALVYCKQDVFFNTCKLTIDEIKDYDNIIINADNFIIKSGSIFKEVNGIVTLCSPSEVDALNKMPNVRLIEHVTNNRYFYNPYYYVITNNETYTNSRVYDFDTPSIPTHRILDKNMSMNPRVNIGKYEIGGMDNGYRIKFSLVSNDEFNALDQKSILIRAAIQLYGNQELAYIDCKYEQDTKYWVLDIETRFNIDNNDMIDLINGESNLSTKRITLVNKILLYTATTDISMQDPTNFLVSEFNKNLEHVCVFTKEELAVELGVKLDYIYNKLYNTYDTRKYLTHEKDVPKVYTEDVYDIDPETGAAFNVIGAGPSAKLEYKILHKKGDPVLDEQQRPVLLYKKGDPVLDVYGEPVVNTQSGVIRYIDMLLLEYEFYKANAPAYNSYKVMVLENLKKYITDDMIELNNKLLENTKICYKSYKTSQSVSIIVNTAEEIIPYMITPSVLLYLSNTSELSNDQLENYKTIIGNIIATHCDNAVIKLEDIKNDIKTAIGSNVSGIKISNLDPSNAEVITIKNPNIKLSLGKLLSLNKNSEFVVKYNIKLDIQYI